MADAATGRDKKPPTTELGTAVSYTDSLFYDYIDPNVGSSTSSWDARDYSAMLRTESQARKVEMVLTQPIISAPITIRPAKGDKGEAEWLTEILTRPANAGGMSTPLRRVVAQATSAFTFRVASFEKVWKVDTDGRHIYDKLAFRPATNTRVLRNLSNGTFKGLRQDAPHGQAKDIILEPDRCFTHIHGQHRHPVLGSSDMEIPLICWKAKQKLRFLWFLFCELHAQPRVAFSDTRDNAAGDETGPRKAAKQWAGLRGGGALGLPPGIQGNVLETGGNAADTFQTALKYLDGEMTGQVLAQFTDLAGAAASGTGSFALSRDQSDFYMQGRRWAADELEDTFNNFVLPDPVRHAFGQGAATPTMSIGPLVTPDLDILLGLIDKAKPELPADFVGFIVEQTATALGMSTDKVADVVKQTIAAYDKAAPTEKQGQLAEGRGAIEAATGIVAKAAARDPEVGRAAAAASQ